MSSKEVEERLVISQEKHKKWENRFVGCFDEMHNRIRGQLLTTMEIAFPEGMKLEALKSRIRDIQNRVWNKVYKAHSRIFKKHFSVVDGDQSVGPIEKKKKIEIFFSELDRTIQANIRDFKKLINNLIVLAEENLPKQEVLKETAEGISDEVYWAIRDWLEGAVQEVFEIK